MTGRVGYFLRATEAVYSVIRSYLPDAFELVTLGREGSRAEVEAARGLDFIIGVRCPRAMLDAAPGLRLFQLPGVGYDMLDPGLLAERGVPLAQAGVGSSEEVAEHAMMLMLAVSRRLVELDRSVREGHWWMFERRMQCHSLRGRTLGIVGMGQIGRQVARRAVAFGMRILHHDPVPVEGWKHATLDALLAESDIVTLHMPVTPATRHLLNGMRIAAMKPGAILINTARGALVDEAALLDALVSGHLAGAGLDVFETEPTSAANPLLAFPQVVVTPHVATGTAESLHDKAAYYAENIRRVLRGEEPLGLVKVPPTPSP